MVTMIIEAILILMKMIFPPIMKAIEKNEKLKKSFVKFLDQTQMQDKAAKVQDEVQSKIEELRARK